MKASAGRPGGGPRRLLVVAGEASGDLLASEVVSALRQWEPDIDVRGMGGANLRAAGMQLTAEAADVAVVGVVEVVRRLPAILRVFRRLVELARSWRPDAVLLVDFPDFNLRLARALKPLGVPILYYVSPQVWAWRRGRVKTIARLVDHMLVIFPFEVPIYHEAGVPVTFVGHPLVDRLETLTSGASIRGPSAVPDSQGPTVALLPGSRHSELAAHMPALIEAARLLALRVPGVRFVLPRASTIRVSELEPYLTAGGTPVRVVSSGALEALQCADAALVASGTATLEAALMRVPMVVVYRVSWLTYLIARLLVRGIHSIGMVNLIAGRRIVPERIQRLDPEELSKMVEEMLLNDSLKQQIRADLSSVRARLGGPGAAGRAARVVLEHLSA